MSTMCFYGGTHHGKILINNELSCFVYRRERQKWKSFYVAC